MKCQAVQSIRQFSPTLSLLFEWMLEGLISASSQKTEGRTDRIAAIMRSPHGGCYGLRTSRNTPP